MINIHGLEIELRVAGIQFSGCNTDGVVWDVDGKTQIQTRPDVAAILTAHNASAWDVRVQNIAGRQSSAREVVKNIPNWAKWTQAQLQIWWDMNLADSVVDGFSIPVNVKNMLKTINGAILRIAQLLIALRDSIWPDLPDVP